MNSLFPSFLQRLAIPVLAIATVSMGLCEWRMQAGTEEVPVLLIPASGVQAVVAEAGDNKEDKLENLEMEGIAQVDSQGIYLDQIVKTNLTTTIPHVKLAEAPVLGQSISWTRAQARTLAESVLPELKSIEWIGTEKIRITRKTRLLGDQEVREMVAQTLQRESIKGRGELELRFARPWTTVRVPDETLEVKLMDLPAFGVSPQFILRFELKTRKESAGTWQVLCQAQVWADVYVAASSLRRGQNLLATDITRERRDMLAAREALTALPDSLESLEVTEAVPAGQPLTIRSLRIRPLVFRGDVVDGFVTDGAMTISLKVEVLQEASSGQMTRVRNPISKRELKGKVQNDRSVQVLF